MLRGLAGILGSGLLISVIAPLVQSDPPVALYIGILSIGSCFCCLETVRAWFEIRAAARRVVPIQVIMTFVTAATKGLLVLAKAPLLVFVIVGSIDLAVAGLATILAFMRQGQPIGALRFRSEVAGNLLRRSWPLLLSGIASAMYLKIDQVMLGWMVSYAASGVYAVAATLSEMWYILAPCCPHRFTRSRSGCGSRISMLTCCGCSRAMICFSRLPFVGRVMLVLAHPLVDILYGPRSPPPRRCS